MLFAGVAVIVLAIALSMKAYGQLVSAAKKPSAKGILLSVSAGILIAFFYSLTVKSIDPAFVAGGSGKLVRLLVRSSLRWAHFSPRFSSIRFLCATPLRAVRHGWPITGEEMWSRISPGFRGAIWSIGITSQLYRRWRGRPAVSYALSMECRTGGGHPLGSASVEGVRRGAQGTNRLLGAMFLCYLVGLALITYLRL